MDSENPSGISENPPMTDVTADDIRAEVQELVRDAAGPWQIGDSVKTLIRRASRRLDIETGRCKRFWYAEILNIPAHEVETIRRRYAALKAQRRAVADAKLAAEIAALRVRLNELETRL